MKNQFDINNYPDSEPSELVAGSRWAWTRPDITEAYPTADYTLKYQFIELAEDGSEFTHNANKTDSKHVFELAIADTSGISKGDYILRAIIIRDSDSEEVVIDEHLLLVKTESDDARTHVYKVLMAVRALIEGKATTDQQTLTVNGRTLTRFTPEEWIKLENEYSKRWLREKQALDRKNGRSGSNKTLIQMSA